MKTKEEVDNMEFTGESSFVKVTLMGNKTVKKVDIDAETLDKDDLEALEDMLVVAINDAQKKIDTETEKKMGRFGNIPGLF
jgi:DNA-binding YbaB/EbfC family protein